MKQEIILPGAGDDKTGGHDSLPLSITISSKNLQPEYYPGSTVFVKKVQGWQVFFDYGYACVLFLTDGRMLFNKVRKSKEDPERNVLCVSTWPELIEEELPRHLIKDVYRVVGHITFY